MAQATKKEIALQERTIAEMSIRVIGTAPMLVAHCLQWDVASYWDDQPAEISSSKVKIKRPMQGQLKLLEAIRKNGFDLDFEPYDKVRGADVYQDAVLRGHWLPDLRPAFPASGFLGAMDYGAVQYQGLKYGLAAKKVRSLTILGDETNTALVHINTANVTFHNDMGAPPGKTAPRHIVRILYELPWEATLFFRYSCGLFTEKQIAQVVAWAGDFGVGQRRPSSPHGGQYGTFRVATTEDAPRGAKRKTTRRKKTAVR